MLFYPWVRNWSAFSLRRTMVCEFSRVGGASDLIQWWEHSVCYSLSRKESDCLCFCLLLYFLHSKQNIVFSVFVSSYTKLAGGFVEILGSGFRLLFCHMIDFFFYLFLLKKMKQKICLSGMLMPKDILKMLQMQWKRQKERNIYHRLVVSICPWGVGDLCV